MEPHTKLLPNTTQVPNIIIDEWMSRLSDVEFKILMTVVRQTIGWISDPETGRRKDRDWISMYQLEQKTGRGRTQISKAIKSLIEEYHLIEAVDAKGKLLDTGVKRRSNRSQIFYRLTLREPEITLFDKVRVRKVNTEHSRVQKVDTQKVNTTKETHITKENMRTDESVAENQGNEEQVKKVPKPPSDHKLFVEFFYETAKAARGVKPIITGADAKMLKNILDSGVSRETLEKAAVFFLNDPSFREFSPTIRTLLSAGVITGILNRMKNGVDFWKKLDSYSCRRGICIAIGGDPKRISDISRNLVELKASLVKSFSMPRVSA